MKFSELRNKKWFRIISNGYVLILTFFVIWMLFFDANSYLVHKELDSDMEKLENEIHFYREEIDRDQEFMEKMKDDEERERFAREKYYLKRQNEDIYIIEHEDSIQKVEK